MSRIFWDTSLFLYLLEDKGELTEQVVALRGRMVERSDELLTSTLTLAEILVRPVEVGDENPGSPLRTIDRRRRDRAAFRSGGRGCVSPGSAGTGRLRRPTRCSSRVQRWPGSICFITNDHRLSRQVVPGIHFIQSFANAAL